MAGDGDPLDAIVVMDEQLINNCYIECKILGMLYTVDEKGEDEKIILVPSDKVDPKSKHYQQIDDLSEAMLDQIKFFYEHYKKMEPGKWVRVDGFQNKEKAIETYKKCLLTETKN